MIPKIGWTGVRSLLALAFGLLLLLLGLVLLPLPTPFGIPLIVLALVVVLGASPGARRAFRAWRAKNRSVSDGLTKVEPYLQEGMRRTLNETNPDRGDP